MTDIAWHGDPMAYAMEHVEILVVDLERRRDGADAHLVHEPMSLDARRSAGDANNRVDNLEVATGAQNVQHSYENGRTRPWSHATTWRVGRERLSTEQINRAREMRAGGALYREISERFGISKTHAHRLTGDVQCRKE